MGEHSDSLYVVVITLSNEPKEIRVLDLHVRNIKATPYKLVMNGWDVLGVLERRANKEAYIEKRNFSAAVRKIADKIHAQSFVERIEKASL